MLKNYLRTARRTLLRYRSITTLNILGLSAGMTAAVLIFLWVDNELSFDSYHPDDQNIYRLTTNFITAKWVWPSTTLLLARQLPGDQPAVTAVACLQPAWQTTIHYGNDLIAEKKAAFVDPSWFSLFHYDFVKGNTAGFTHHPHSLILTESKAKKYFGDNDPIGRNIQVDSIAYQVTGVIRDNPANSSFQFDILMPVDALLADSNGRRNTLSWNNYNFPVYVKLRPAADPAAIGNGATDILHRSNPPSGDNTISLTAIRDMHFESDVNDGYAKTNRKTVYTFSILGIFLLLIACINYVNLTTARASQRAKEVGVRKIVGASRQSLFLQFTIESLTISLLSLILTIILIQLALPFFRTLTGTNFGSPFTSPQTWKIIGLSLLAATALNSIYPALLLSSFRPLNVLKGRVLLQFKDVYLRKGLVVLQFTFSIILIASTIVIQHQLQYVQHTNPGYDRSQLFTFRLPWTMINRKPNDQINAFAAGVKQQLLAHPAIAGVSFASQSIVDQKNSNEGSANWDGKARDFVPVVHQLSADESFKTVTTLEMQQGRWFDPQQPTDRHNFILNETAINQFNIRRPVLGQRFYFQGDTGTIIGIVKDFHYASMHEKISPLVIINRSGWRSMVYVKTAPGKATEALKAASETFKRLVPDQPFDYTFLDETFDALYKSDTRTSDLILIFSVIAILISCLGLLGLAAFSARQRVKEIGIRKVLGATIANILTLLSRDFIILLLLSIGIATPLAWWAMHSWLQDFAYHIPLTPWAFIGAGSLAITIALVTVATQSIRAATSNPVTNLRTE